MHERIEFDFVATIGPPGYNMHGTLVTRSALKRKLPGAKARIGGRAEIRYPRAQRGERDTETGPMENRRIMGKG